MISDFGLSKTEEDGSMMATACGTPGYVGRSFGVSHNPLSAFLSGKHSRLVTQSPRKIA